MNTELYNELMAVGLRIDNVRQRISKAQSWDEYEKLSKILQSAEDEYTKKMNMHNDSRDTIKAVFLARMKGKV